MTPARPLISVVTVCRNALPLLKTTVESVLAQTYPCIQYVIIDGASSDGTPRFLERLDSATWISEPDRGIFDAMNKGAWMATGEWIIFMNAGDTFASPDVVERVFAGRDVSPYGVIYGNVLKAGPDGRHVEKPALPPANCHRMFFCHQSAFYRRSDLLAYPFDLRHPMSADIHQVKRLLRAGVRFCQLDFPVAVFDTNGVSNARRSSGLRDNISVVCELDPIFTQIRFLPKLLIPYLLCRLRGK